MSRLDLKINSFILYLKSNCFLYVYSEKLLYVRGHTARSFVFEESSPNNDVDEDDGSSLNKFDSIFSGSPNNEVDSSFSIFTFTVDYGCRQTHTYFCERVSRHNNPPTGNAHF